MCNTITPRVDMAFKKLFGVNENKDLLISLVNSIVSKEDQVQDVTLLNPYTPQNFKNEKGSILDIKAIGENGKRYNIEIQITNDGDYDKRALYYWAKLYTEQLEKGKEYASLEKAIGIHILNFISIPSSEKYHNVFRIREDEGKLVYFEDLELHTIELKKFTDNPKEDLSAILSKIKTTLDIWSAFLTRYDLLQQNNLPKKLSSVPLKKALSVLEVMSFGDKEREDYESRLKWLRSEASTLKKARKEGREEGREEGMEIGEKKGKKTEKLAIAKAMSLEGLAPALIVKFTGFTEQEINHMP